MMSPLFILILSALMTVVLVPFVSGLVMELRTTRNSSERSFTSSPVPRVGGVAMALGMVVSAMLWAPPGSAMWTVLAGAGVVACFGFVGDIQREWRAVRLAGLAGAALMVASLGKPSLSVAPGWSGVVLTAALLVVVSVAFRMADGTRELCGTLSLATFVGASWLAWRCGDPWAAMAGTAGAGALLGFLRFRTPPSHLLLGDSGGLLLGFLAASLALLPDRSGLGFSPVVPVLLVGLPVVNMLHSGLRRPAAARQTRGTGGGETVGHGDGGDSWLLAGHVIAVGVAAALPASPDWLLWSVFAFLCVAFLAIPKTVLARGGESRDDSAFVGALEKFVLRVQREHRVIRISFRGVRWGVPLLLLAACAAPADIPLDMAGVSLVFAALLSACVRYRPELLPVSLRACLYFLIPLVICLGDAAPGEWMHTTTLGGLYDWGYMVLAALVLLSMRTTRRGDETRIVPMGLLILLVALLAPSIPLDVAVGADMTVVAVRVIVVLFSVDFLISEQRGEPREMGTASSAVLVFLFLRGVV
ncbi:MAG: hypothetical protein ACLFOY_19430 [Desulfatibacillaceae bacterium]